MQFIVIAYDGSDPEAPARRSAARPAHLALGDRMIAEGTLLYAVAILDDAQRMIGSVIVVEFPDRAGVDRWLAEEPYVTQCVWEQYEAFPGRVGPSFARAGNNSQEA